MVNVIGVSFRSSGKVYYFSPGSFEVNRGDYVIVETARGVEIGKVAMAPREMEEEKVTQPLRDIIRVATKEDKEKAALTRAKEKTACSICKEKIKAHGLEMKLIDAEYTFDESKLLFYFTADGRVDFRELVKDLASEYRIRIELRQVGVRDETKILGGIGICGRVLCCHSYLSDFVPVSIKMAKEQNLSLNPTKISGSCGRLMCCLKYEQDVYEELNRHLPGVGDVIVTKDNMRGRVDAVDVLGQKVRLIVEKGEEKEMFEIEASQIAMRVSRGKKKKTGKFIPDATEEELKALEDRVEAEKLREAEKKSAEQEKNINREKSRDNGEHRDNGRRERSFDREKPYKGEREGRRERGEGRKDRDNSRRDRDNARREGRTDRKEPANSRNREAAGYGSGSGRAKSEVKHGFEERSFDRNENREHSRSDHRDKREGRGSHRENRGPRDRKGKKSSS